MAGLKSQNLTKIEIPELKLVKSANLYRVDMSSHNVTSIAISREVHYELSQISKMHQSYNDVVKTLITEHWENVGVNQN